MITMSLGPYASFILTSYILVGIVLLMLIGWIAIDYWHQKERLRELEAAGIARRSGRSATEL
jgi:heme exporter protein D